MTAQSATDQHFLSIGNLFRTVNQVFKLSWNWQFFILLSNIRYVAQQHNGLPSLQIKSNGYKKFVFPRVSEHFQIMRYYQVLSTIFLNYLELVFGILRNYQVLFKMSRYYPVILSNFWCLFSTRKHFGTMRSSILKQNSSSHNVLRIIFLFQNGLDILDISFPFCSLMDRTLILSHLKPNPLLFIIEGPILWETRWQ